MKKSFLLVSLSMLTLMINGQSCDPNIHFRTLGTSGNILSMLSNRVNPLAYDSTTHSLVFVHRNNPALFGGTTGDLRFDRSSDTGNVWTRDLGILNPGVAANKSARYPQAVIHHPSSATTYSGNYLLYYAPTSNGSNWNGHVSGVRKLNNAVNTEHYNQAGTGHPLVPGGLCKGAGNNYWTVDIYFDTATATYGPLRILKGNFSNGDITWSLNNSLTPAYNLGYDGLPHVADWNIAFDPSGQKGWAVVITHLTGSAYTFRPVFYKTTNGGSTWSGPFEIDLGSFASVNAILPGGAYPTSAFQVDLAVDALGHPHALMQIGSSDGLGYSILTSNQMAMFDIMYNGTTWKANYLYDCYALSGYFGNGGQNLRHDTEPQVSRSLNGEVIAFTWTDTYGAVSAANDYPDLYGMFYSASTNKYSTLYDYTSCSSKGGQILLPRIAPTLISKGNGKYQLPVVMAQLNVSGNELDPASYYYIDDLNVNVCDFATFSATASASGATTFCSGDSVQLTVNGSYSAYLWSNGATTGSITAKQTGSYVVTVTNGNGCQDATPPIAVYVTGLPAITINAVGNLQFCPGSSVQLVATATGANSYKWKKNGVAISGATNSSYTATTGGTYTCVATNSCGNKTSNSLVTTKLSAPTASITPAGTVTMCQGDTTLLTANAVTNATYKWLKNNNPVSGATNQTYKAVQQATYKVKITKTTTGCSTTSTGTTVQITCREVLPETSEKIRLFPNPASGKVILEVNPEWDNTVLRIYNSMGQQVKTLSIFKTDHTIQLDLSSFPRGIFLVQAGSAEQCYFQERLILQ